MSQLKPLIAFRASFTTALKVLCVSMSLTGVIYPLFVTGLAKIFFPFLANGSLIIQDTKVVGSKLIGQSFKDPKYFKGRPSATRSFAYNPMASGGSNLGPTNPKLIEAVKSEMEMLKKLSSTLQHSTHTKYNYSLIPIDLVTTSGSGLDPHITPESAFYQIPRISKIRELSEEKIVRLVERLTEYRQFGFLGEPRINVLILNLALDELSEQENKIKK